MCSPDTGPGRFLFPIALLILTGCSSTTSAPSASQVETPKTGGKESTSPRPGNPPGPESEPKKGPVDAGRATPSVVSSAGTGGWTTFRGTPQRTGRADVAGPRAPRQKWVFRTKGRIYADATIARDGDTIYVASFDGNLYAVDPAGREKWSRKLGGKIWGTPAIGRDGTIYVGSDADQLVAIDPSGSEKWAFSTRQPYRKGNKPHDGKYDVDTSPLVLDDGSVVFGCDTNLFALRPLLGGVRWMFEAGAGRAKIFSSPAMGHDGTIYFGTQGRFFFALSQSAKVLWHQKTGRDNDSTAAIGDDGTIYFGSDDHNLRAMAPGGELRWEVDLGHPVRAPVSVGHDGTVIASTYGPEPFIAAFAPRDGRELWRFAARPGDGAHYGIQSGALVDAEGYVYFGGRDHYIYCLSPSGEPVWEFETGDQVDSGPVLGPDGTLYVGSDDRRLYAFGR